MTPCQVVAARVAALILFPAASWAAVIPVAVWLYRVFIPLS